jgi:tight adherence protein B
MGVGLALVAAIGVFYLYTAIVHRWSGLGFGPSVVRSDRRRSARRRDWLAQAGLADLAVSEFASVIGALLVVGALFGFLLFGGIVPALVIGLFAASLPIATSRHRRTARIERAQEAWPRMIEEIRILTSSVGRSIPQALFEVGRNGPDELRPAFAAAHREWLLSTDFPRTLDVLKAQLADPTADATCETLLIAHELGGTDLDHRLEALAQDRRLDTHDRKDARAKQAGARFARRFVLIVPLGMALAGMSVGNGRSAYQTPMGQLAVVAALAMVVACWVWAGFVMHLPDEERVFHQGAADRIPDRLADRLADRTDASGAPR